MINSSSKLRIVLYGLLGLIIAMYTIFQAQKLITGPTINIYSPANGSTYNQPLIQIEGRAKNIAHISLNDRPIFTDKTGYFQEKILLSPGYNIIKISAEDKFKNYTEKKLELILKEY